MPFTVKSQLNINQKFGKVSKEELAMEVYSKDSAASAVILFDKGKSYFKYSEHDGWYIQFERHLRVKVLTKEGLDYANFEIPLYHEGLNEEKLTGFKAATYNLDGGKISKEKMRARETLRDEKNKFIDLVKVPIPAVKEGSVFEIEYGVKSQFFYNLQEWKFQHLIPVMYSEYDVSIPEYFYYNKLTKGYLPYANYEENRSQDYYEYRYSEHPSYYSKNKTTTFKSERITYDVFTYNFLVKDAPAFEFEDYMLTHENYISQVKFELSHVKFPGSTRQSFSRTWETINKELINSSHFGGQLKNGRFLSDEIEKMNALSDDPAAKLVMIYNYIKNNYRWNNIYAIETEGSLRDVYKEKSGNIAEINLLLTLMLREAGFKADPVIISTRGHGLTNLVHPSLSQMNYIIAHVNLDGKSILLDASNLYCLPGMLPPRCINDRGRLISENDSKWIDISAQYPYSVTVFSNLDLSSEGTKGNISMKYDGYAAYNFRKQYANVDKEEELIKEKEKDNPGLTIGDYEFSKIDSLHQPVEIKYLDIVMENSEEMGDIIYFTPVLIDQTTQNPFKLPKRDYPVDFTYPYNYTYTYSYKLPEGFTIDELPKSEVFYMPDKTASYQYIINKGVNNTLQIMINFKIDKRQYLPDEYEALKEFYNTIIRKESEQVVLKRI